MERPVASNAHTSRRGESLTPWDFSTLNDNTALLSSNNADAYPVGPTSPQKGSSVDKGYTGRNNNRYNNTRSRQTPAS